MAGRLTLKSPNLEFKPGFPPTFQSLETSCGVEARMINSDVSASCLSFGTVFIKAALLPEDIAWSLCSLRAAGLARWQGNRSASV